MSFPTINDKIDKIKATRRMTGLLGKLGICPDRLAYSYNNWSADGTGKVRSYGVGLRECKDWVELYLDRKQRRYSDEGHLATCSVFDDNLCTCRYTTD